MEGIVPWKELSQVTIKISETNECLMPVTMLYLIHDACAIFSFLNCSILKIGIRSYSVKSLHNDYSESTRNDYSL